MKFFAYLFALLFFSYPLLARPVERGADEFLGTGIGTQAGGTLLSVKYDRYLADWFLAGLTGGALFGMDDADDVPDRSNAVFKTAIRGDVLPTAGAVAYLVVPRGIFRGLRFGAGIEGYRYDMEFEAVSPAQTRYSGRDEGLGYNYNLSFLSFRFSPRRLWEDRLLTFDLNLGARVGGTKQETLLTAPNGDLLTLTYYPNSGVYFEFLAGLRF